jgi:hypothetical protein
MAYHAMATASTAPRGLDPAGRTGKAACSTGVPGAAPALNIARFAAYIALSINNERR